MFDIVSAEKATNPLQPPAVVSEVERAPAAPMSKTDAAILLGFMGFTVGRGEPNKKKPLREIALFGET